MGPILSTSTLLLLSPSRSVVGKEWLPTHMQMPILQMHSLQAKGLSGFSSPFVVIQLRKQTFTTSVMHRDLGPEQRESCLLKWPQSLHLWEKASLILAVRHHLLWFSDQFLGQICLPLKQLFQGEAKRDTEWVLPVERGLLGVEFSLVEDTFP
ncbi:rab11 family-interacting protein 2-like [Tamandua tetradactyla]|uniref:rab11 family-interacting protein 2-like n=1 Tax=Tamandua tetradactyla TaxID=48850 RepID=UPI004053AAD9